MSNNDLYCSKCKSQHHPVECPKDYTMKDKIIEHYLKEFDEKFTYTASNHKFFARSADEVKSFLTAILNEVLLDEDGMYKYLMAWNDFNNISEKNLRRHSKAITAKQAKGVE